MKTSDFDKKSPGKLVPIIQGQLAFVPNSLPPCLKWTPEIINNLAEAERAIGRLGGVGVNLANPYLLIGPFVRREAVLSSRIEGTQAVVQDLYLFDMDSRIESEKPDVREVSNYVNALNFGLARIRELPLCLRLISELHSKLMDGVRGYDQASGQFRRDQNFVGPIGSGIEDATYIPPPPMEMQQALKDLEMFVHSPDHINIPMLIRIAMIHYQFEAIHPFRDGNGRIGRLLITLMLCLENILPQPLLYLSAYFERHRDAYYHHLFKVSQEGCWTEWIVFFLQGVIEQAKDAFERAHRLMILQDKLRQQLHSIRVPARLFKLMDELFVMPVTTISRSEKLLKVTHETARKYIGVLVEGGILRETTGRKRNRIYLAEEIMRTISD